MTVSPIERSWIILIILAVTLYLIGPTLLILPQSVSVDRVLRFPPNLFSWQWYAEFFQSELWMSAVWRTLKIGTLATLFATFSGLLAAFAVHRSKVAWRNALEFLALAPLIVPPIIIASGGYSMFEALGMIGSDVAIALVHAMLGIPYVYILVSASLTRSDPSLELAAQSVGASPWRVIRDVTLPMNLPSILTGALFAFLMSFDEVILTIFLSGSLTPTLPVRVFSSLALAVSPVVAAVSAVQILFALFLLGSLGLFERWSRKRRSVV